MYSIRTVAFDFAKAVPEKITSRLGDASRWNKTRYEAYLDASPWVRVRAAFIRCHFDPEGGADIARMPIWHKRHGLLRFGYVGRIASPGCGKPRFR